MRAAGVIFSLPIRDLPPGVEQVPEPAHVQALVAQLSIEAFHASILGWFSRLDVNEIDLPLDGPGEEVARSQLRAVITANRIGLAMCRDRSFQFSRDAPAGEAG